MTQHHSPRIRATVPRCRIHSIALLAALLLWSPLPAAASDYTGWGDTGWKHDNKRDCCEDAVWLAQEDSIRRCELAGGQARVPSGTMRGFCDWEARGDRRDEVFRCKAEAKVACR
jgi:hypothetical protein